MTPTRFARWAFLGCLLTLMFASACEAQRGVAIVDPPLLGWFTLDSSAVTATAEISSADWPEHWVEALAAVRKCSGVKGDLRNYHLFTVTAGLDGFRMRYKARSADDWDEAVFAGWTFPDRREIYLTQMALNSYNLLMHEMLHAILAEKGMEYWHGSGADGMFARCFPK